MKTISLADRTWHFYHAIGWDSTIRGFRYPCSIAVDNDNKVWVLSRGMSVRSTSRENDLAHQPKIGKWSVEDGVQIGDFGRNEFIWPTSLASDSKGYLYCSDEYSNFIATFSNDGPYYEKLGEYDPSGEYLHKWGEKGPLKGQLDSPSGIAFDTHDNLFVVDSGNNRIQKLTTEGGYLDSWGTNGNGNGEFNRPWGITIDANNNVFVADWGNNRVQKFDPDGSFVMSFGAAPCDEDPLLRPSDIAVDSVGDVYVADWGNNRVKVFESNGEIIGSIHGDATEFFGPLKERISDDEHVTKAYHRVGDFTPMGKFNRPVAIEIDDQDRLFVVDSRPGRVQIYSKDPHYEQIPLTF